jgi:uncharacterized membrane protein
MRRRGQSSLVQRTAATATAIAMAFVAFASAAASASTAKATINTFKNWDGVTRYGPFGCAGAATTFGQTITVPARLTH